MAVEPRRRAWAASIRQLMAVPASWGPSPEARAWLDDRRYPTTHERFAEVTRKVLAARVGRLCAYTPFLLRSEDVSLVAELLSEREQRRMSATSGRFRVPARLYRGIASAKGDDEEDDDGGEG